MSLDDLPDSARIEEYVCSQNGLTGYDFLFLSSAEEEVAGNKDKITSQDEFVERFLEAHGEKFGSTYGDISGRIQRHMKRHKECAEVYSRADQEQKGTDLNLKREVWGKK